MGSRVMRLEYDDFDRFRASLVGWNSETIQLSPAKLKLNYYRILFDTMAISRISINCQISERITVEPNWFRLIVNMTPYVYCGISVPAGSLTIYGPGRDYRTTLPDHAECLEFLLPSALLHSVGLALADACPRQLEPERCVIDLTDLNIRAFRALAENPFFQTMLDLDTETGERWAAAIRERSVSLLTAILRQTEFHGLPKRRKPIQGWPLVARALAYVDQHRYDHVSVTDISTQLGCSCRALQFAFQDALRMTPNQYLVVRRLHLARSALLAGRSGGVTRVAADHHFFHFGRFSHYYQTLFGELPSETLQRGRTPPAMRPAHDRSQDGAEWLDVRAAVR